VATAAQLRARLKEIAASKKKKWDPLAALHDYQRPIFLDSRYQVVLNGTRQYGKTRIACVTMIDTLLNRPKTEAAYVDMDIEHGEKVLLKDLQKILDEYDVPARIVDGEVRFENGSIGYVFSGANTKEVKKLQGLKLVLLIIDEAQESSEISNILTMCSPALLLQNGRILLMGIPGRVRGIGYWWEVCEGEHKELFAQYRGSFWDNTTLSQEAKERLYESEKKRLGETNPEFVRHWKGEWPDDDKSLRVYHYDPAVNGYDGDHPPCPIRTLGLDPGGVRDAEANEVLGHGREDGNIYQIDELVTEKKEGGDWDDTGNRTVPLWRKNRVNQGFYDYGSAHKGALALIYEQDSTTRLEAVPEKDPYNEAKRINELFQARRLWIKKGSRLHFDLLYTMWDAESLGKSGKKPEYSKAYKQNACDALRAAMWGVYGYVPTKKDKPKPISDVEAEAKRIADGLAYKKKPEQRSDKYTIPTVNKNGFVKQAKRPSNAGFGPHGY
jgi:hypothetical protein